MGRKSSIDRLPCEQRAYIEQLLRSKRYTLDELLQNITDQYPDAKLPSRSSLGRYKHSIDEMLQRMSDIDVASRAIVSNLGENADEKGGALLVQAVSTLATDAAMRAIDPDAPAMAVSDIGKLARAAKDVMHSRNISRKEREEIARIAAAKALEDAAERHDEAAREYGMSDEQAKFWREKVLFGR